LRGLPIGRIHDVTERKRPVSGSIPATKGAGGLSDKDRDTDQNHSSRILEEWENASFSAGKDAAADRPQAAAASPGTAATIDEDMQKRLAAMRTRLRERFGTVVLALMTSPRYRHMSLADLQQLVLEPLAADRIAIAHPRRKDGSLTKDLAGVSIWASVSEEVDAKIREQIRNGVFPVRLKPDEWRSGDINWLLDVIAPNRAAVAALIAGFRQLIGDKTLRLHPVVTAMLDRKTMERMGIHRIDEKQPAESRPPAAAAENGNDEQPAAAAPDTRGDSGNGTKDNGRNGSG
jgi:hemolysin-activating ACP:hemolysin acyltransferase